ncbi:unnamed protein product [Rotaria sordida]|uniref:Uncharacterized protein n=1 Tax=Rotaria sordida TaxID=392033 RepID=A0A813TKU2_9BILA|nr:unnamed protein product [Rotaria sordida]CAF3519453.1 unnamed protein product [Rotaria sordida]
MSIDEPSSSSSLSISSTDLTTCIKVLSTFTKNNEYLSIESDEYQSIRPIIHNLYHIGRGLKKNKKQNNHRQIKLIDQKTIRLRRAKKFQQFQLEHTIVPDTIEQIETKNEDNDNHIIQQLTELKFCYICKQKYHTLHFFYDQLCPSCAKLNYEKRLQTTDLTNCIALVTNGRIKIGYRIVLKLLRANCFVITTSRFSIDFLNRLNKEQDFEQWKDRIHIYEIDFRYSQLVELFTKMLIEKYDRLDFLINNVCQTIQQSKEFYQDLFNHERLINYSLLSNDQQKILNGNLQFYERLIPFSNRIQQTSSSSSSYPLYLPYTNNSNDSSKQTSLIINNTSFDVNQQSIDFRSTNSCLSHLNDLSTIEINEVLTINTLAPFILNSKLKVLMDNKHPNPESIKFIINVSTMESSFSHSNKTDQHPHTNAAFAALNMMTRTSAIDYLKSNIYMISVDTGLIKDENSSEQVIKSMIDQDFQTPFDEDDAAARVLDPIIDTYKQLSDGKTNINIPYGCFLKDYHICNW